MNPGGHLPGRILGIDYGSRRVGLAVSDPLRIIAQGVGTIDNDQELYNRIAAVIRGQDVVLILVGDAVCPRRGRRRERS